MCIKIKQLRPTRHDLLNPSKKPVFPERSIRVNDTGKKHNCYLNFSLEVVILLQRMTTIAKKLLVDDKKTACAKNKCLLGVTTCKDSNRKTFSGETFCFLENLIILCFE